eukprot:scaffold32412_cov59-Attheya_sp.AAC.2
MIFVRSTGNLECCPDRYMLETENPCLIRVCVKVEIVVVEQKQTQCEKVSYSTHSMRSKITSRNRRALARSTHPPTFLDRHTDKGNR